MARVLERTGEVRDNAETDSINVDTYVKNLAALTADLTKAPGRMFEQEHLIEDDQRGFGDSQGMIGRIRRMPQVYERYNRAQGESKSESGEWRQRLVQTGAPEVHHRTRPSEEGVRGYCSQARSGD